MSDPTPSLTTRWSMLEGLRGHETEEAWRWFVERYADYITAHLRRGLPTRELAEQATEEVWSYLFTSAVLENADRGRSFRAYLAGTLRNYARGWLRGQGRTETADVEPGEVPGAGEEVEREELRLWKSQVVQLALAELAKRHPEQVQALRWFYGLPEAFGEPAPEPRRAGWIAEQLGLRANAVHQLLFRGRLRLRSCIENELRETVRDGDELEGELARVLDLLEEDAPGLAG